MVGFCRWSNRIREMFNIDLSIEIESCLCIVQDLMFVQWYQVFCDVTVCHSVSSSSIIPLCAVSSSS